MNVARPLRFRYSPKYWSADRVASDILEPLQDNIGASAVKPRHGIRNDWDLHRFEMDNGDLALFARNDSVGYWMGNTETPRSLWRTDKRDLDEVPFEVARWAQREFLTTLLEVDTWFEPYPHLSWFFLPIFMAKDGRRDSRRFFKEYAAGFADDDPASAATFFERFLHTGKLDEYRISMIRKLGTSRRLDLARMSAAMAEIIATKLFLDAGYSITPEIEVAGGYVLDLRIERGETNELIEITRPQPLAERSSSNPLAPIRESAAAKAGGQLSVHRGSVTLCIDCSSLEIDSWRTITDEQPSVSHRPTVIYRVTADGHAEGYSVGRVPFQVSDVIEPIES